MKNLAALFSAFGGPAAVAKIIGKSTEHVATMKRRGSIPIQYWPAIIDTEIARSIDLNEAVLVRIHLAHDQGGDNLNQASSHAA